MVWQKKKLPSSDAQQVSGNTKITGVLRLGDADFKIDGVKTDPAKPLPAWRQYKVKDIKNVVILDKVFSTADGYNPTSKQYARVIAKI